MQKLHGFKTGYFINLLCTGQFHIDKCYIVYYSVIHNR